MTEKLVLSDKAMIGLLALADNIRQYVIKKERAEREAAAELYRTVPAHWLTSPVADGEREVVG